MKKSEEKESRALTKGLEHLQDIERGKRLAEKAGEQEKPEEYRYFFPEEVTRGLNISSTLLKNADDLIHRKKHDALRLRLGYRDARKNELLAEGTLSGPSASFYFPWTARVVVNATSLLDASCSEYACYSRADQNSYLGRTLCVHELAALLLTLQRLKNENPGDTTNEAGQQLLSLMQGEGTLLKNRETGTGLQRIEPYLRLEQGNLKAYFRIGEGKLYKIRKIPEFLEHVRNHREMIFGSKTRLMMGKEFLSSGSLPWFSYLEQIGEEDDLEQERYRESGLTYRNIYTPPRLADGISLYGEKLDHFFAAAVSAGSDPVEFTRKDSENRNKEYLAFRDYPAAVSLQIRKDEDPNTSVVHGIRITGNVPQLISGREYAYYIADGYLNRIPKERQKELTPLLVSAEDGMINIRIGRKNLADFYRRSLPRLRQIADVTESDSEEIAAYLPPEAEIICYLDIEQERIICRADACYGTQIFPLSDLLDRNRQWTERNRSGRDLEKEIMVLDVILRYLPEYDEERSLFSCARYDQDAVYQFLNEGLGRLMDICEVRGTDAFRRLRIRRKVRFQVGVSVENHLMDLSLTSDELSEEELLDVLEQYRAKRRFVRLKNGDFLALDENEAVRQLEQMMETMRLSPREFVRGKMQIPAYRALYLDKMLEKTQDIYASRDTYFKRLVKEFKTVEDADFAVPDPLRQVLRKYQIAGYRWLRTLDRFHFGGILADDMGLGKTVQMIAVFLAVHEEQEETSVSADPSLIVCPASLVYNWGEEFRRFAPSLKVSLITGTSQERSVLISRWRESDVLVTSYDLLKRDIAEYEDKVFRFAVIDEAQYIKNASTAAAKAVKVIQAQTRFALTGTPIENRLSELWSVFDFLMPGFLYDYASFRSLFEVPITKYGEEEAALHLRRMVQSFILRRLKQDVLTDLPEKLEEVRYAKMEKKQQKLYDAQVVRMRNEIRTQEDAEFRRNRIQILAELTRIRQICCDPSLCFADYDGGSAKREACLDLIRSLMEAGHKTLLFSQFTSMLELLKQDLEREKISFYEITGATPKEKRNILVRKFNEDETPVFLISLKAGGTGLNLTGADAVIHYDPWWNLAVQNQATDRAHRIGQMRIVTVYRMIVKDSIEEKIMEIQETKRLLADDILSGDRIGSSTVSREDILALLD